MVLLEAIIAAEQAAMTALETIAQIDVDMDARRRRRDDHHHANHSQNHSHNQSNHEQQQLRLSHSSYSPFLDVLTREVIPHASAFAVHPERSSHHHTHTYTHTIPLIHILSHAFAPFIPSLFSPLSLTLTPFLSLSLLISDARVVVAASLRRLIPAVLRTLTHSPHDAALVSPCLDVLLTHIPYMLADHAPIPQVR